MLRATGRLMVPVQEGHPCAELINHQATVGFSSSGGVPAPLGAAENDCLFRFRVLQDNDLRVVKRHSLEGLLLLKHLYVWAGSVPLPTQVSFIPPLFQ